MPHASLKLIPGVDQNRTPALNEAAISDCQLIRFMPDRQGIALPQKMGGWTKFTTQLVGSTALAMCPWLDLNAGKHVAVGGTTTFEAFTETHKDGLTPERYLTNIASTGGGAGLSFQTTVDTPNVIITDTGSNVTNYDSVFIANHVSVGGLVLFGSYKCYAIGANSYQIIATDVLGNPVNATSSTTYDGVDLLTTTSGQSSVLVKVVDSNVTVGSTYTILTPYYGNGLSLYGDYVVTRVVSKDEFYIEASSTATATGSSRLNGNTVRLVYSVGGGPASPASGYGVGGYGGGGYGGTSTSGMREISCVGKTVSIGANATIRFGQDIWVQDGSLIEISTNIVDGATVLIPKGNYTVINGSRVGIGGSNFVTIKCPTAVAGTVTTGSFRVTTFATATDLLWPTQEITYSSVSGNTISLPAGEIVNAAPGAQIRLASTTPSYTDVVTVISCDGNSITITTTPTASTAGAITFRNWEITEYTGWTIDVWGGSIVASYRGGPVYYYDPLANYYEIVNISTSPQVNEGIFVAMPQRQIIAYGSSFTGIQDPLLVRWCDVQNFTSWVGTVVNQAGSYRLPRGSKIVGGLQVQQQGLLWTDVALWTMQYVGLPYIYSFNEVSTGCGLIGQKAVTTLSGTSYWMGQSQFFSYGGGGLGPIACPVWDVAFQDLDRDHTDKIIAAANSRFGEVMWFYPTVGSEGRPTKYVKYNTLISQWDFGSLERYAWCDQSVYENPLGIDRNGKIFRHEDGNDDDGSAMNSYFTTGFFALSEGDVKAFVDQIWPDMKWGLYGGDDGAQIEIKITSKDYPSASNVMTSTHQISVDSTYVTPRIRARLMSIRLKSNDIGSFWRLGNIRYRTQVDGKF